jgi:catechol 2,3-dioxygenase-like lactoylglutathione lyase family enzyme
MAKLRGLAIVARDPNRLADFYRQVFELKPVSRGNSESVLSDGTFNLVLRKTDGSPMPGLYAACFQVEDGEHFQGRVEKDTGKNLVSGSAVQRADPDGNLVEVAEMDFPSAPQPGPFPIRHIALYTPDPKRLADFYTGTLNMREVAYSDRSSIFVSDGYFNLALLFERPGEEKPGFNHFGFHVKDIEEMRDRAEKAGGPRGDRRPERIPFAEFRLHDLEGNGIDISVKGWKV